MQNPFTEDIYPVDFDHLDLVGNVPEIHEAALRQLSGLVRDTAAPGMEGVRRRHGETALLTSSRAGLGKTHLLHRLAKELEGDAIVIPITFNLEQAISWRTILSQSLDRLAARDPSTGALELVYIQEVARRMFSEVTALLIAEGEIPSANPQNAIAGLKRNYLRLFDAKETDSAVRDWLTNNFGQLRPVMADVLSEKRGMVESSAGFWLDILRDANEAPASQCAEILAEACPPDGDSVSINSISRLRLSNLCRLASVGRPLVFVFDQLDCFHGHPECGLEIAYLISETRQISAGQVCILAMNQDLWASAFGGHLPEALADRLSVCPTRLQMLRQEDAEKIVLARGLAAQLEGADIEKLLQRLELPASEHLTPRVALRCAARIWDPLMSPLPSGGDLLVKETLSPMGDIRPIPPKESVPLKSLFDGPQKAESLEDPSPSKVDPTEIKKKGNILAMVERLKKRRQEVDGHGENVHAAKEVNGTNGNSRPGGQNGTVVPIALRQRLTRQPLHPLVQRFRRLREELSPDDLSQESLRGLVRAVGQLSPVVEYSETNVPHREASLARWEEPDAEVFFCFATDGDPETWSELLQIGAEKVRLARLDDLENSKLVIFAKDGPAQGGGDLIAFDASQSKSLEAAARLLADPSLRPVETLSLLSGELDFFWKRVMRCAEVAKV